MLPILALALSLACATHQEQLSTAEAAPAAPAAGPVQAASPEPNAGEAEPSGGGAELAEQASSSATGAAGQGTEQARSGEEPAEASSGGESEVPESNQALYDACRSRVEGPELDGECKTDEDCVRAGCSSEVCLAREHAGGFVSTCEVLPCFQVLDSCGCHEGRCTWSLKTEPVEARPGPGLPGPR